MKQQVDDGASVPTRLSRVRGPTLDVVGQDLGLQSANEDARDASRIHGPSQQAALQTSCEEVGHCPPNVLVRERLCVRGVPQEIDPRRPQGDHGGHGLPEHRHRLDRESPELLLDGLIVGARFESNEPRGKAARHEGSKEKLSLAPEPLRERRLRDAEPFRHGGHRRGGALLDEDLPCGVEDLGVLVESWSPHG